MESHTVIVFGPTGGIGSAAARTAESLGAKVVLAMRDTTKAIPGLDAEREEKGNFQRMHADYTQPETVINAVQSTSATRAFLYCDVRSPDGMKATIEALKAAGVNFVVFNSSFTIQAKPEDVSSDDLIPYVHARVEMTLTEVMGTDAFVAIRPGSFATNLIGQIKAGLTKGQVMRHGPDSYVDCIVPEDIGTVAGTILTKGPPEDGNRTPYIYGPKTMRQSEAIKTVLKVLGKEADIVVLDDADAYKLYTEVRGAPPVMAKYMIQHAATQKVGSNLIFGRTVTEEELQNVKKYSGREPTTLSQWAERNKALFS